MTRAIDVTLGGMTLPLRYEAANMFALSEHTGQGVVAFLDRMMPRNGESVAEVGLRCSDFGYALPVIAAGLAHLPEYEAMPYARLKMKLCQLIDAEAERSGVPLLAACAKAMTDIIPVLMSVALPPGVTLEQAAAEADRLKTEETIDPLAEAPQAVEAGAIPIGNGLTS